VSGLSRCAGSANTLSRLSGSRANHVAAANPKGSRVERHLALWFVLLLAAGPASGAEPEPPTGDASQFPSATEAEPAESRSRSDLEDRHVTAAGIEEFVVTGEPAANRRKKAPLPARGPITPAYDK
jgi:hypothetical protein